MSATTIRAPLQLPLPFMKSYLNYHRLPVNPLICPPSALLFASQSSNDRWISGFVPSTWIFSFGQQIVLFWELIESDLERLLKVDLQSSQTLPKPVADPKKLPKWNYDGWNTGQAPGEDGNVIF
ncbi:unnamed protein product [Lactuca virosa]|uniref:Chlorophyll a-b binding protein, chloroplastic n=1 Tax=Lactuca virosa TaxID=75947 RepID=A0AAU9PTQ5_9ASTR|nr:unnamed protein product [Lactuca virosa]